MVTPTSIKTRFAGDPYISGLADAVIQPYIDESAPFFDPVRWDDLYDLGVTFWVAHYLTVDKDIYANPQIDDSTMKKVGDIAKSRSEKLVALEAEDDYYRTKYGSRLLYYRRLVGSGGVAV